MPALAPFLVTTGVVSSGSATGSGAFTNGACVEGDPLGQLCPPPGEAIGGAPKQFVEPVGIHVIDELTRYLIRLLP